MDIFSTIGENILHIFFPRFSNNQRSRILHPVGLSIIVGLFLLNHAFSYLIGTLPGFVLGFSSSVTVEEVIAKTNEERRIAGLPPLTQNPLLTQAAYAKASDMFARDYWAHISPTGTQPWDFIKNTSYSYQYAGENLARDFSNSHNLVEAWMASTSHRDNILSSRYQDIGIAVVDGTFQGVETRLVVQMFGSPAPVPVAQAYSASETNTNQLNEVAIPGQEAGIGVEINSESEMEVTLKKKELTPKFPATAIFQTQVQAADKETVVSPNRISQVFGMFLITLILATLMIDWAVAHRKKAVRLVGKNWAHFLFLGTVMLLIAQIISGSVL